MSKTTHVIRLMCGHFRYFSKHPGIGAHRCYTCEQVEYEDISFTPNKSKRKYGTTHAKRSLNA